MHSRIRGRGRRRRSCCAASTLTPWTSWMRPNASARCRSPARPGATPCWRSAPTARPTPRAQVQGVAGGRAGPAGPRRDAPRLRRRGGADADVLRRAAGDDLPQPRRCRAGFVLWVSDVQLTALAWSEISYWLGRLEGVRFEPRRRARADDHPACSASSRAGARCASRMRSSRWRPCRPSAAPARRMSQEALLDHVAGARDRAGRRPLASS